LFFFFQAEDGIRDLTVTGVQTCALPILPSSFGAGTSGPLTPQPAAASERAIAAANAKARREMANAENCFNIIERNRSRPTRTPRSEERRVGKECRSGWTPENETEIEYMT